MHGARRVETTLDGNYSDVHRLRQFVFSEDRTAVSTCSVLTTSQKYMTQVSRSRSQIWHLGGGGAMETVAGSTGQTTEHRAPCRVARQKTVTVNVVARDSLGKIPSVA